VPGGGSSTGSTPGPGADRHDDAPRSGAEPREESGLDFDKLYAARLQAARARPYLAAALYALHVVESRQVLTMAVDRYWRCYASPAFAAATPVEELASVWVHEVSHLLRDHHGRSDRLARTQDLTGPGDRLRMNVAADCEINDDVYGEGLPEPAGVVTPEGLGLERDGVMEDYVHRIRLRGHAEHLTWLDCGSGADGMARAWEHGPEGAHALSDQERDAVRFRVAEGITARPGDTPRAWRRWAEEAFHAPQPWRALLGAAVRSAATGTGGGQDYTYGRPSRRSAGLPGVVLPSLRRRPPRVTVVVDTSGSVSDTELGGALLEVAAITRALGGRRDLVSVISCDAAAHRLGPLCAGEGLTLLGGGGTDLRAGFDAALKARLRPDVVVALTDGQTPWPGHRPPCRTVVGLFSRSSRYTEDAPEYAPALPPEWARVVEIG
jgi:predicted metal-dependent peptidase